MTLAEAIDAINNAKDRPEAEGIRNAVIDAVRRHERPQSDWQAVCDAVIARWGVVPIGGYWPSGFASTGD